MGRKYFGNGILERKNAEVKMSACTSKKETVVELV
jgi:hypothetical protein